MHGIVDIQLRRFNERLAKRDITATVTDAAKDVLIQAGWDPQYGARPLKRAIQRLLENELATRLLSAEFVPGDTVAIDANADGLTFEKRVLN